MGKCGSKYRNNPASSRLDSIADYDSYPAGSSGLGFGDFGFTGRHINIASLSFVIAMY